MSSMFTKILTSTLLFLVAIGGFFVSVEKNDSITNTLPQITFEINQTYAAWTGTTQSDEMKEMYNKLVAALNIALVWVNVVIAPAVILASWLMSPDWTSGDAFGLREIMHKIWIIISNIIYFVYAILLIIIALATIFGKDNFSYKTMLPKLALGILMVPFTWWFVQWTISLSTVVTASVLTIPQEVMASMNNGGWWEDKSIPWEIIYDPTEKKGENKTLTKFTDCNKANEKESCISPKDFYEKWTGIWAPLVVYGYGIFKFQQISELKDWQDGVSSILQLVHQWIFWVLMFLVFGVLVIALIFILMTRAIKLWIYAMFSPLFTLHFVAGKELMGKMWDWDDTFSIKEFIWLCFVPAIIGLTLSFWLIVLSAVILPASTSVNTTNSDSFIIFWNANNTIASVPPEWDRKQNDTLITLGDMKIRYIWGLWWGGGVATQTGINSVFGAAWTFFWTIIIDIIALVFIWTAFMAAKWVNKAVWKAMEPFDAMGKKVGWLAASIPKYTPLPIPGGSIAGANKAVSLAENMMHEKSNKKFEESATWRFFGADKYIPKDTDNKITEALKGMDKNSKESIAKLQEIWKAWALWRESAYMWDSIKEFHTLIKDPKWLDKFQIEAKLSLDEKKILIEEGWKDLTEPVRKKLTQVLNSKFWTTPASTKSSTSSSTWTNWFSGEKANTASGNITLNFNGLKIVSWTSKEDIIKWIKTKKAEIKDANKVDKATLIKILEESGVSSVDAPNWADDILNDITELKASE